MVRPSWHWAFAIGLLVVSLAAFPGSTRAVDPDEILKDAALEERARKLSAELRCLVCQNQSIDDSNAPLARDLRLLVRERISAGDSDAAAMDYIVARYGDFVLLRPPFNPQTALLWALPLLLLLAATGALWRRAFAVRSATVEDGANDTAEMRAQGGRLTADEEQRLVELLATTDERGSQSRP